MVKKYLAIIPILLSALLCMGAWQFRMAPPPHPASREGLRCEWVASSLVGNVLYDNSGFGHHLVNTDVLPIKHVDGGGKTYLGNDNGNMAMTFGSTVAWASSGQDIFAVAVMELPTISGNSIPFRGPMSMTFSSTTISYLYRDSLSPDTQIVASASVCGRKITVIMVSRANGQLDYYLDGVEIEPQTQTAGSAAASNDPSIGSRAGYLPIPAGFKFYSYRGYVGRLPTAAEIAATYWDY